MRRRNRRQLIIKRKRKGLKCVEITGLQALLFFGVVVVVFGLFSLFLAPSVNDEEALLAEISADEEIEESDTALSAEEEVEEVVEVEELIVDDEPPVIEGVEELSVFIGDAISYKSGVTVTDNIDENVKLEVDTSRVDTETEGTYLVVYSATDSAGNTTYERTWITLSVKPANYVDEDVVLALAQDVLDEITTEDMTKKQIAKAIYTWCRSHISYVNTSEKDYWTTGAYQGFTTRSGDCFIYFSTAKALLTQADIPNLDVEKSDTSHSSHYWSLVDVGDGWYHFDTTPRSTGGDFFLLTDAELLAYSEAHYNSHIFDSSLYPATPTTDSTIE